MMLFNGQEYLMELLKKRGYHCEYDYEELHFHFSKELNAELPEGYHFVDPMTADPLKLAKMFWYGFDNHLENGPFENWDKEGNVILTEGLVLQDKTIWENFLDRNIAGKSNSCELYFEENDLEVFVEKLERLYPETEYVNQLMTHSWGQKVVRFYDLDGNLIEVGTPM